MPYIDFEYYSETFGGSVIPAEEFEYIANAASEAIDAIVTKPISAVNENIKKACAYQADTIYIQGAEDALAGMGLSVSSISESIGDYTVGGRQYANIDPKVHTVGGIPVSGITLSLLRREGLLSRIAGDL